MTDQLPPPSAESVVVSAPPDPYVQTVPRRRGRFKLAIATMTAAAVAAGAVFAIAAQHGTGGSSSPEAAVKLMVDSLAKSDVLGVLDALAPAERDSFRGPLQDTVAELERLGIVKTGTDLTAVPGLTISFSGLHFQTTAIGAGVSEVEVVSGSATVKGDWSKAPLGDFLISDLLGGHAPTGSAEHTSSIDPAKPPRIATIQVGGTWYVSLWYSVAEAARRSSGQAAPAFGHGVAAVGAASPQDAVRELVSAATALDARRIIQLLPPGETAALHDYAPLLLPTVDKAVAALRDKTHLTITVDKLDLTEHGTGTRRTIGVSGFAAKVSSDTVTASVEFANGCVNASVTQNGATKLTKACASDVTGTLNQAGLSWLSQLYTRFGADAGITVVEDGGAWYVSPVGTVTDSLIKVLRVLNRSDLKTIKERAGQLFSGLLSPTSSSSSAIAVPSAAAPVGSADTAPPPTS